MLFPVLGRPNLTIITKPKPMSLSGLTYPDLSAARSALTFSMTSCGAGS